MKKLLIQTVICLLLFGCNHEGDNLLGKWVNGKDGSVITINKTFFGFNYKISSSISNSYINDTCDFLVLYSNNGFNCYRFPDKTARLAYQPATRFESELLTATNIKTNPDDNYYRIRQGNILK